MSETAAQQNRVEAVGAVYQATAAEFREAVRVLAKTPRGRFTKWILTGIGLFLVALGLRVNPQGELDWFSLLYGAAFLTFFLVIAPRLQARQAHRRAQAGGQRWVIVDATGFTVSTQHDRRCSGWPTFSYYRETTHLFVVISADKRCMTFVPKRALQEPDGTDRLRRILDQHLPETTRATPAR